MDEKTILKKSRKRKPSATPRMRSVAVRLPEDVIAWYRERYAFNYTASMRGVLLAHARLKGMKKPLPPLDTVKE